MTSKEKAFIIRALRRASLRWPARTQAKQAARVERGKYTCAGCGTITRAKDVSVDHRIPCVDVKDGFVSWDEYISRLFCERENLQILCRECHNAKSALEMTERVKARKAKAIKRARRKRKMKDAGPGPDELLSPEK